jgi:hypothetical protein
MEEHNGQKEEQFLCPLLYIMADGVAVGHPVSLTHNQHDSYHPQLAI